MIFSSNEFVFFFMPLAVLLNLAVLAFLPGRRPLVVWVANLLLLACSIVFYGWGEPRYVALLVASAILNYFGGLCISLSRRPKAVLAAFTAVNLAALLIFKYANFFQEIGGVHFLDSLLPEKWRIGSYGHIALPVGISFYTFQGVSYLVDVYRRAVPASRSFVSFACYLTMFPQLIAGPIVRFSDIHEDLLVRRIDAERLASGCARFIIGLAKKALIADTFGRVADAAFGSLPAGGPGTGYAWLGIVSYTLQIYYDFSGYSDMALGIGDMLGVSFPENFKHPYSSKSIREFWRRWHISLSTWFRDYLYIPLGGNRAGAIRTALNLMIVFALCGFWHGASYNFLLWGLYHGFFLSLERLLARRFSFVPGLLKRAYTLFAVMMGWVLFRADTLSDAILYTKALFGGSSPDLLTLNTIRLECMGYVIPVCLVIGIAFAMPLWPWLKTVTARRLAGVSPRTASVLEAAYYIFLALLLAFSAGGVFSSSYQSFIYFRF